MTTYEESLKDFNVVVERVVNAVFNKKTAPGINIKSKAKRCIVMSTLTNRSYLEIGWTMKSSSSEQALDDLTQLSKQLEKAKDTKKVEEIEGKIQALEDSIDILRPAGPFAKYRKPHDVLTDPNGIEPDLSDSNWIIVFDVLPTQFLLAKYAKKKSGSSEYESIFAPSHIMKIGTRSDDTHEADNFSLYQEDSEAKQFGFDNQEAFEKAKMTRVAFVWDKITRRVLMYNDADWTWPIWVWDDPLQLDQFFPVYPLWFYENLDNNKMKGEVTYYLDQQDAINEMVDEERRARYWARRNLIFNKNVINQEDVQVILNGPDGTARGIDVSEEIDLQKMITSIPPPGINFRELFDKESKYQAIDRISSVGEVLKGTQFKTNTNRDAVNANVSAQNMRVDEKSDQIEDWIGRIGWGIAQLCLMYMDQETVTMLTSQADAEQWQNFQSNEIQSMFNLEVVGGSGKKPTSQAKKEEAIEVGQTLGQFVQVAPGPVLKIMLQVMQEAFDEITIRDEDWDEIIAAVAQQTQEQAQGAQGAPQAQAPAQGQAAQAGNGQQPQQGGGGIDEILAQLPLEVKKQVIQAIQSGMPPQQALETAMQSIQQ
jgi:hypothetical protein